MKKERVKTSVVWHGCSDEEFVTLVKKSKSYAEILNFFGLTHKGGNSKTVKARIKKLNILTEHIVKGVCSNKGRKFYREKIPISELFVENCIHSRCTIKKRIIEDNILENKCSECGVFDIWNNKPIILVLDHKNGIPNDNRIENLRLLCPNCNSQQETFAGKHNKKEKKKYYCKICGKEKLKISKYCYECSGKARRKIKNRPSKEQLEKDIKELPMTKVGLKYGVSDNTIRKWVKSME